MGICDMHSHLLPEIDDGYLSREQFIRMLNLYQLSGVTAIAFTPHIFNPYVTTNISELRETYQWARGEAEALGLQTYLGSELFVGDQETLKTIPINGRFALVEFGLSLPPPQGFGTVATIGPDALSPAHSPCGTVSLAEPKEHNVATFTLSRLFTTDER